MKRRKPIVITGFMGCGKSKVARELARLRDAVFVDLDDWITTREGRTPAQLITQEGERAFRAIESQALRELLRRGGAGVIALGGGAWIEETNRKLIEQHGAVSVWLDVPFEICWARIEASTDERPLGKTKTEAEALYHKRKPIYELAQIHHRGSVEETLEVLTSTIESQL